MSEKDCFPDIVLRRLMEAADQEMAAKLRGFSAPDARLAGRTSPDKKTYNSRIIRQLCIELSVPDDASHQLLSLLEACSKQSFETIALTCKRAATAIGVEEGKVRAIVAYLLTNKTHAFPRYQ